MQTSVKGGDDIQFIIHLMRPSPSGRSWSAERRSKESRNSEIEDDKVDKVSSSVIISVGRSRSRLRRLARKRRARGENSHTREQAFLVPRAPATPYLKMKQRHRYRYSGCSRDVSKLLGSACYTPKANILPAPSALPSEYEYRIHSFDLMHLMKSLECSLREFAKVHALLPPASQYSDRRWQMPLGLLSLRLLQRPPLWQVHCAVIFRFHKYRQGFSTHSPDRWHGGAAPPHGMRRRLQDAAGVNVGRLANLKAQGIGRDFNMDEISRAGFDVQAGRRIGRWHLLPIGIEVHGWDKSGERSMVIVPTTPRAVIRIIVATSCCCVFHFVINTIWVVSGKIM